MQRIFPYEVGKNPLRIAFSPRKCVFEPIVIVGIFVFINYDLSESKFHLELKTPNYKTKTFIYKVYFWYTMSTITTIKLQKSTKSELDKIKLDSESYNAAIKRLVSDARNSSLKEELIEAYKGMGSKDLELLEEWEQVSNEV